MLRGFHDEFLFDFLPELFPGLLAGLFFELLPKFSRNYSMALVRTTVLVSVGTSHEVTCGLHSVLFFVLFCESF